MKHKEVPGHSRRTFLKNGGKASAGLVFYGAAASFTRAQAPSSRMRVAIMGLGRGMGLMNSALAIDNTEVAYVCDVDDERLAQGQKVAGDKQKAPPKADKDIRRVLEDKNVDAIFIAAPNHWHAPATIMGCVAGKHVYVEKPCSHNPWEGEMMVAAARKYNRVVQMGNQRRSWPVIIEAMQKLKDGAIGPLRYGRSYYNNARGSIGRGKVVPVPEKLDYSLWQGPAPDRPYKDNLVHYNWHWHWHWGNGELGNNGIHALDLVRWGLGVTHPRVVSYTGGRYHFEDDQETPDSGVTTYDFGEVGAMWDGSSCHPRRADGLPFVAFYGENGSLEIRGADYKIFDLQGKLVEEQRGDGGEKGHIQNFFECIKSGERPNSDIEGGHISTLMCHLGNIAYRTRRTLVVHPDNGTILNSSEAMNYWKREYRPGWEPKI